MLILYLLSTYYCCLQLHLWICLASVCIKCSVCNIGTARLCLKAVIRVYGHCYNLSCPVGMCSNITIGQAVIKPCIFPYDRVVRPHDFLSLISYTCFQVIQLVSFCTHVCTWLGHYHVSWCNYLTQKVLHWSDWPKLKCCHKLRPEWCQGRPIPRNISTLVHVDVATFQRSRSFCKVAKA